MGGGGGSLYAGLLYSQISLKVHLYKTDTSVRRTPRVAPSI